MPLITAILTDVSGTMGEIIQHDRSQAGTEPCTWARSTFNVIDNLIKYDVSSGNLVFTVGVGGFAPEKETFDVLDTVSKNRGWDDTNERHDTLTQMINRILTILEKNGAPFVRKWATIPLIENVLPEKEARMFLWKLDKDTNFARKFVECLPSACREVEQRTKAATGVVLGIGLGVVFGPLGLLAGAATSLGANSAKSLAEDAYISSTGKRATEEDIIELVTKAKGLLLSNVTKESVLSVHVASDILHRCIDEKELTNERISELMDTVEPFIYGRTPLFKALRQATDLLAQPKYKDYKKLLFVLSDGDPTDKGTPPISELRNADVHVVCCYITRSRRVETKRLYSREQGSWDEEARFMFRLSSSVETQSLPRTIFVKRDWKIDVENNETRLFLQVNHPDHIKDACDLAKNVVCCQDALADCLSDVSLDLYINQQNRDFAAKEQEGSTCYANATAAVLHLAMKRIVGRDGGCPHFYALREGMIWRYGKDGATTYQVLQEFCPKYRLRCKYLDNINEALEAIAAKRPVVARFELTRVEWASFSRFFKQNEGKGILTTDEIDIKNRPRGAQTFGHAVVLTSFNSECLRLMNSKGVDWGDKGFFRIKNADVLGLQFFDVYWTEDDLSQAEKAYYRVHGKRKAAELIAKLRGLQLAEYECPLCKQKSLVSEFSGKLTRATCPKCRREFSCRKEGNLLALNMYLTSLGS